MAARVVPAFTSPARDSCRSRSGAVAPKTRSSLAGPAEVASSNSSLASRRRGASRSSVRCRSQTEIRSPATGATAHNGSKASGG